VEDILFRLVELNAVRAAEARAGVVRWLRPEFQKSTALQAGLGVEREEEMPAAALARSFTRARVPDVVAILETLAALGQARHDAAGYRT
jgi:hypothetical protein